MVTLEVVAKISVNASEIAFPCIKDYLIFVVYIVYSLTSKKFPYYSVKQNDLRRLTMVLGLGSNLANHARHSRDF